MSEKITTDGNAPEIKIPAAVLVALIRSVGGAITLSGSDLVFMQGVTIETYEVQDPFAVVLRVIEPNESNNV